MRSTITRSQQNRLFSLLQAFSRRVKKLSQSFSAEYPCPRDLKGDEVIHVDLKRMLTCQLYSAVDQSVSTCFRHQTLAERDEQYYRLLADISAELSQRVARDSEYEGSN